jgi:hypothetical protein
MSMEADLPEVLMMKIIQQTESEVNDHVPCKCFIIMLLGN